MVKINVIGSFFNSSGYSIHTKELSKALDRLDGVEVTISTTKPQGWEAVVDDQELEMLTRNPDECDVNLLIAPPPQWRLYSTQNKPFVGFVVWEGDKIPLYWLEYMMDENVKGILVPSEHVKKAISRTINKDEDYQYIMDKIKIIPHGVNPDTFFPKEVKRSDKFTFLCNKGFRGLKDRGGVQDAIRAYLEEFTDEDNVLLMLKINPAYPIYDINKAVQELKPKDKEGFAPIQVNTSNMKYEEMRNLYNQSDVFVSPTRAEAFNIPCIESMACGVPVITNDFGGQIDFVNDENGWLLKNGKMFDVTHELPYEGIKWKGIDIEELKKVMRRCYTEKSEVKKKGLEALKQVDNFTWKKTAEKLVGIIKEIL